MKRNFYNNACLYFMACYLLLSISCSNRNLFSAKLPDINQIESVNFNIAKTVPDKFENKWICLKNVGLAGTKRDSWGDKAYINVEIWPEPDQNTSLQGTSVYGMSDSLTFVMTPKMAEGYAMRRKPGTYGRGDVYVHIAKYISKSNDTYWVGEIYKMEIKDFYSDGPGLNLEWQ